MVKNNVKYTYKEVKKIVNDLGYELISKEYLNIKDNLILKDKDGYFYTCSFDSIKRNHTPNKFSVSNLYTIKNLKNWIKINNKQFELISDKYLGSHNNLIFKDYEGYYFMMCPDNLLHDNLPSKFGNHNPFTFQNIKLWLQLNNIPLQMVSNECLTTTQVLIFKDYEGYFYISNFNNLKCGNKPDKFNKSNPYTIHNIKLWCKLNNKPFELISKKYCGNVKKLKWQCLKETCNEIFEMNWGDISQNNGCPYCAGVKVGLSNCLAIKNPKLTKEWHPILNGSLTPWEITCASGKMVWWQCKKGHEWRTRVVDRNKNKNCPYCSKYGTLASKEYNLLLINPILCEEWNYEKNDKLPSEYTPVSGQYAYWKCKECDNEWRSQISNRTNGNGCPVCNESKGEKEIDKILINNNWVKIIQDEFDNLSNLNKCDTNYFIPQKTFEGLRGVGNGLLSYDHYLPNINLLIEYQGQYHDGTAGNQTDEEFKIQKEHDRRKKEYALSNGYNFLEIWYWDFDNIESILEKYLLNMSTTIKNIVLV